MARRKKAVAPEVTDAAVEGDEAPKPPDPLQEFAREVMQILGGPGPNVDARTLIAERCQEVLAGDDGKPAA